MNAMHVGYTRYDRTNAPCNRERTTAVEREFSSDNVEAQMSVDGSLKENLFCDNQAQDQQSDRNAMNAQIETSEQSREVSNICKPSQVDDSDTRAEDPVVNQVSDPEDTIIDKTLELSTVKDCTRSKSKKYNILQAISHSDSEDEIPRPPRRKGARRGSGELCVGVNAKFLRRKSSQF
jgi:hypothetical protein